MLDSETLQSLRALAAATNATSEAKSYGDVNVLRDAVRSIYSPALDREFDEDSYVAWEGLQSAFDMLVRNAAAWKLKIPSGLAQAVMRLKPRGWDAVPADALTVLAQVRDVAAQAQKRLKAEAFSAGKTYESAKARYQEMRKWLGANLRELDAEAQALQKDSPKRPGVAELLRAVENLKAVGNDLSIAFEKMDSSTFKS